MTSSATGNGVGHHHVVNMSAVQDNTNQSQLHQKTTCLLCPTHMLINSDETGWPPSDSDEKRQKMFKTLCEYQGFQVAIPDWCSERMFPLCRPCQTLLERLSGHLECCRGIYQAIEKGMVDAEV